MQVCVWSRRLCSVCCIKTKSAPVGLKHVPQAFCRQRECTPSKQALDCALAIGGVLTLKVRGNIGQSPVRTVGHSNLVPPQELGIGGKETVTEKF